MIRPIRYYGDPVLRKAAKPVTRFDEELDSLVKDMRETMYAYNGVGIAAPQVGESLRVFLALEFGPHDDPHDDRAEGAEAVDTSEEEERDLERMSPEEKRRHWGVVAEHVMVNPELRDLSGSQYGRDGCLSLPGLFVEEMRRDRKLRVDYQDLGGRPHTLTTEGHFAHVIQHENDHLDGVLFIDWLDEGARRDFMDEHRQALAEMQREAKALLKELKREPRAVQG
ncbi:peptide deformylase [soil metagenome]